MGHPRIFVLNISVLFGGLMRLGVGRGFDFGSGGLPGVGVGGGFGVVAEIPDVEVHAFFAHGFDEGVFAGGQIFGGSEFEPASADAGGGGFHEVLLLADLAGDLA